MSQTLILPKPVEAEPGLVRMGRDQFPPMGGVFRRIGRTGARYKVSFTNLRSLSPADARRLLAKLIAADTAGETVIAKWPQAAWDLSIGTPLVAGADQAGSLLNIDGLRRHNVLNHSDDLTQSGTWTRTNINGMTGNAGAAADGAVTADKVFENATNGVHAVQQDKTGLTADVAHTGQLDVKAAERTAARVRLIDSAGRYHGLNVNLSTGATSLASSGTLNGVSAAALSLGSGWYRITITAASPATQMGLAVNLQSVFGTDSYAGNTANGILVSRASLAVGSAADYRLTSTTEELDVEGYFFHVLDAASHRYLYGVTGVCGVTQAGAAALPIGPLMRKAPADNCPLVFDEPEIEGFVLGDVLGWKIAHLRAHGFALEIMEAR